jgi:hypothetical protein
VTRNNYSYGWAWAGVTPFQGTKGIASHLGGIRVPLVISWQRGIRHPGLRSEFTHVNDIVPTIYDAARITPPRAVDGVAQTSFDGRSLTATFRNSDSSYNRRTQYFEMWANRALYSDGWLASARHTDYISKGTPIGDLSADVWELHDLSRDFSQSRDLADSQPERLSRLRSLFDDEARRNFVHPLLETGPRNQMAAFPLLSNLARRITLYPGGERTPALSFAVDDRPYRIEVSLTVSRLAPGSRLVGLCRACQNFPPTMFISHRTDRAALEFLAPDGSSRSLDGPLVIGPNTLSFDVEPRSDGRWVGRFSVNGTDVGEVDVDPISRGAFELMAETVTPWGTVESVTLTTN